MRNGFKNSDGQPLTRSTGLKEIEQLLSTLVERAQGRNIDDRGRGSLFE